MDTSETYIKQCEKAPRELTEYVWSDTKQFVVCCYHKCLVEYDEGYHDWRCDEMEKAQDAILCEGKYSEHGRESLWGRLQKSDDWCQGKHWIKLLTQDQLQEMVYMEDALYEKWQTLKPILGESRNRMLINAFGVFNNKKYDAPRNLFPCDIFASMEQLWLAFVMKEKYNKIWNGEEWITN